MPKISKRIKELGTEQSFEVLGEVKEQEKKGKDIINFCIGQSDFDAPENVKRKTCEAIRAGKTKYSLSCGINELRGAIAKYIENTRSVEIDPKWINISNGSRAIIAYSIFATTDFGQGHEIIYTVPGFPIFENQIKANGAVSVPLYLREADKFSLNVNELEEKITKKTKLLILNSPHNPTGNIIPKKDVKRILDLAIEHDFFVLSDEIYSGIVYDEFTSFYSFPDALNNVILMDGVSKRFAMPAWRIGWAINKKLANYFSKCIINQEGCASQFNQYGAVEALLHSENDVKRMCESYKRRRNIIVDGLNKIKGISCLMPQGTFYAYPNITEVCKLIGVKNAEEFRKRLLEEAGCAVIADTSFGNKILEQEEHIRLSFAINENDILIGLDRLKKFVENMQNKQ